MIYLCVYVYVCVLAGGQLEATQRRDAEWFRFLHALAEGPELEGRIPLECNLDLLHSICFKKGCYIGQELTARTKFKVIMPSNEGWDGVTRVGCVYLDI